MIIFQSLHDIMVDSILDIDLSDKERKALLCSMYGVPFHYIPDDLKPAFKTGVVKFLNKHQAMKKFYERG